ncbi:MAG: AMP-binding protein, partial [Bdellovibrionota bacterium]
MSTNTIESILHEERAFLPPSPEVAGTPQWLIHSLDEYHRLYEQSLQDPDSFYREMTKDLTWFSPWTKACSFTAPDAHWFAGGTTNLCYNCVDRHVENGFGDETAIIWEGEPMKDGTPEIRRITYRDLQQETAKLGNALKNMGAKKGDVVTIYMGMVPELAVALLACARIGVAHSVIFGGFSAQAIADRVQDAKSRIIITADGLNRRGQIIPLKEKVDEAIFLLEHSIVEKVIYVKRCGNRVKHSHEQDVTWDSLMESTSDDCPPEPLDSEHMSFLLYTSGSTGKPKGIQHTIGGYMVHTYLSAKYVFNLIPDAGQVYW